MATEPDAAIPDQPLRAALLALGAAAVLSCVDALVKTLVVDHSVVMVAWVRMGIVALVLGARSARRIGSRTWRPAAPGLQVLRGLSAVLGTVGAFIGFRMMPLAECLAIMSVAPIVANLLSQWWLGERGSGRTWLAAILSFVGVMLVVRPGLGAFAAAAIYPGVGMLGLATFITLTRAVARTDPPELTAYFGPLVAFIAFSLALPWFYTPPASPTAIALFAGIGILASLAQVLQTQAFRLGSTHQLAPISYSSLGFAMLIGWLVFGDLPDRYALSGVLLIAVAGIGLLLPARAAGLR